VRAEALSVGATLEYASLVVERVSKRFIRRDDGALSADIAGVLEQRRARADGERAAVERASADWQEALEAFVAACTLVDDPLRGEISIAAAERFCARCAAALEDASFCPVCGLGVGVAGQLPSAEAFQAAQRERDWLNLQGSIDDLQGSVDDLQGSVDDPPATVVLVRLPSGEELECPADRVRDVLEARFAGERPRPDLAQPQAGADGDAQPGHGVLNVASWSATLFTDGEHRQLELLPDEARSVLDLPIHELTSVLSAVARDRWRVVNVAEDRALSEDGAAETTRIRYLLEREVD
jgi:hypothetical protein